MLFLRYFISAFTCLLYFVCFAQEVPKVKFGKVSMADLQVKSYSIDTGASAVVLYENGSSKIVGNDKGWFSIEFKIHKRIHILKKSGYRYTNVQIPLYTLGDDVEKLTDLKAVTYNIINGKVSESKLEKESVFRERKNRNLVVQKFTFPGVVEGSIIEYEYKITSDFLFNLQPWAFQDEIPKLWSEYTVSLPQFLNYTLIGQGALDFYIKEKQDKYGKYLVRREQEGFKGESLGTESIYISCGITDFRWAMKQIPALFEEPYTSAISNYIAKLEFQLAAYKEPLTEQKILTTWEDMTSRLIKRDDFGKEMETTEGWLKDHVHSIVANAGTQTEKAKRIFLFIRDNFTCTDYDQLYTEKSLRTVFNSKNGGVAEINLLLTAMLRLAGIDAAPVILSKKQNGIIYEEYPIIGRFNYVICRAIADQKVLFLDASLPFMGFGKLNTYCYNGKARVVDEKASEVLFSPDQLTEEEKIDIDIKLDEDGNWTGKINDLKGYYESYELRRKVKEGGEDILKSLLLGKNDGDIVTGNFKIDSLENYEIPLYIRYDIKKESQDNDIVYIKPVLAESFTVNPFKSTERKYPVELPYKIRERYTVNIKIPSNYQVDEVPEPLLLKMDFSDKVLFDYKISKSADQVQVRYDLQIDKTVFYPLQYDILRGFFEKMIAKMNEQIVFKKKQKP